MELKLGDIVESKDKDLAIDGELLDAEALQVLKDSDFRGEVSQLQDDLVYVSFQSDAGWVTQVFKEEEIEVIK